MKRSILTCVILLAAFHISAQIDYQTTNTTQGLWNFGNSMAGKSFVVGNNGAVLSKEENCGTWNSVSVPVTNGLRDVAFINDTVGIIVGVSGTIIRTTDGGETWQSVVSGVSSGLLFATAFGTSSFIAGGGGSSGNLIIKSDDFGLTWTTMTTSLASSPFDAVVLSDSTIITCGVMGNVYRSIDNGVTWNLVNDPVLAGTLTSISFIDDQIGFIAAQNGNVFKTVNGGSSWATTITGTTAFLNAVYVDAAGIVYAAGNTGTLIISSDTGSTWVNAGLPFNTALRVLGEDAQGMLIGGNSGLLFRRIPAISYDIIFREDFCNFTDSVAPANGWSNISGVDSNSLWRFDNPRSNGLNALFNPPFAVYDAQLYNNVGPDSAILSTGDFSTTNYSEIALRWREGFLPNQDGTLRTIIQGWDGTTWNTIYESAGALNNSVRTASYTGPNIPITTHRSVDLPNMGNLSNTRIRFIFVADGAGPRFWWGIDDIEVVGGRRDIGISNIVYNDSICTLPATDSIMLSVTNFSDFPVFPIQLAYQIGNGQVHHRYFPIELDVNADTVLKIDNVNISAVGLLSVWIEDAFDRDPGNDSLFGFYGNQNLSFTLGDSIEICEGDSLALFSGVNADQYIWNGTAQSDTLWVKTSGWYTLQIVEGNCSSIDSVWVNAVAIPQNVLINLPSTAIQGNSIILPHIAVDSTQYQILLPQGGILDTLIFADWTFTLADTGVYQIHLRLVAHNCETNEQSSINVSAPMSQLYFNDTEKLRLYPNPARTYIVVENIEIDRAELFDLQGRRVLSAKAKHSNLQRIDLHESLANGTYILRIYSGSKVISKKVQITK
jgi:photosystem II stability/assembly factor-like uncharacterized protein